MAFAYVLDPTNQFQNRAGVNNVHGFFKVYLANTDDLAVTYKDFNGTLNPERIDIDNNGRAVIIADSSRPYRVEMYEPNGDLVFTQQPVWTVASGGGMTMVDIESTDGSVSVQKTSSGGMTTYDLSTNPEDDPAFLDWIKCSWYDLVDGAYVPRYASGTMSVGARGVVLSAGMHYHITATIRANKSGATPFYDNIGAHFSLFDGENTVGVQDFTRIVDHSLGLSQDFQVDADVHVGSLDSQLVVSIDGAMEGVSFDLVSLDAHRIYSGVPKVPDGIARQDWVNQNFQKKLVAGENITIDPVTNVISADAAPQQQADWDQNDPNAVDFIKHKPSIPAPQVNSDWNADSGVAQILNKPNLATVATTGNYEDLNNRPTIPAAQVNSDWNANSGVAQILNKPNLATVAESGSYNDLSDKPSIPAAQVNSDWNANSGVAQILNKPNLATVATTGNYSDLNGTPTIPVVKTLVAGQNVTLDETPTTITISAEGGGGHITQVQANWDEDDPQDPSYIRNRPNLATVAESGSYEDLTDKPTIPAAQVNSDWNANSGVAQILNKPNLATVAESGSYEDLTDKPTIPAAQVNSDWNADSGVAQILNKPNLATVATTGNYSDLNGTPSIPAAQVNSDWNANSGVAQILNKPSLATVAESGSYNDLTDKPTIPVVPAMKSLVAGQNVSITEDVNGVTISASGAPQQQADWAQTNSSAVDFIKNKPSIPAAQVNSDWNANSGVAQILNKPNLATVAESGSYNDLTNKPTIPPAQVQASWTEADTSSKAYIQNKPSLAAVATSGNYSDLNGTPTIPTVDQTYDATSTNAQSGAAVAQAVSGKEDEFDAGEGLEFTTDGQGNRVLQVEGPVDIVAGPGIVIDNPDGNTLRVSQAYPTDETVLFNSATAVTSGSFSEAITNFEKIRVYGNRTGSTTTNNLPAYTEVYLRDGVPTNFMLSSALAGSNNTIYAPTMVYNLTSSAFSFAMGSILNMTAAPSVSVSQSSIGVLRVVGVHRIANN